MEDFYANLIISGKQIKGEVITYSKAITNIKKKFGDGMAKDMETKIKTILMSKGYDYLIK